MPISPTLRPAVCQRDPVFSNSIAVDPVHKFMPRLDRVARGVGNGVCR